MGIDPYERKKAILRSVIDAYIATGEPVGSKYLATDFNVSSATIRNEMSDLENMGYLDKESAEILGLPEGLHTTDYDYKRAQQYKMYSK